MKNILIIEDDSLVADVYRQKLSEEGFDVEVAVDGRDGLETFQNRKVDLVLLDLLLPQINGIQVLQRIRSEYSPKELPVLVFTNAYLGGVMQQAWDAGANQVIPKAGVRSGQVIQMIKNALVDPPPAAIPSQTRSKIVPEPDLGVRKRLLDSSSKTFEALWRPLKQLASRGHHPDSEKSLRELFRIIRPLAAASAIAGLDGIAQMSSALEALVKELCDKPEHLSPSTLLTIAQAVDTLGFLFQYPDSGSAKNVSAARVLVVDDDEFARRAVSNALARVNLRAICVDGPTRALKRRTGKRFDLIVLDIELPDADGFQLCSRFRAMPACKDTPIIFVSMHKSLEDRVESALRGGSDYIAKPFLSMELATKALSFVITGALNHLHATARSNGNGPESAFSRRDLKALKQALLASYN
ncbi:MAG: response regulator [Verrucomicrobiia bacterium]